jgi:hypothetical protein
MGTPASDALPRLVDRFDHDREEANPCRIDALRYELYGLTEEGIRTVEGQAR